jgi:hypothetical protein
MTRRDFVLIADALKACRPAFNPTSPEWQQWSQDVRCMANALSSTNGRFDRQRFIAHCEEGAHIV